MLSERRPAALRDVQRLAAGVVERVLGGRNLDATLRKLWADTPGLAPEQRAAIQDLSFGTLRFYGRLKAELDALATKPVREAPVRCLLLVALYQLESTHVTPYTVVDQAVEAARTVGQGRAHGLVNAILRAFLRRGEALERAAEASEVARYSHPQWWIDKLKQQYPAQWQDLLAVNNRHPLMTLRVNRRLGTPAQYLERLATAGLEAQPIGESALRLSKPVPVERLPGFGEGLVSVQDLGAQFAAQLLDARDGERVLDACSAPGGKTAHLAERNALELVALDQSAQRLAQVRATLARLKLEARVVEGDAGAPERWWDGRPFDRILADVPCSASGVVRRHPDIKWLRREEDLLQFAQTQRRILDALWHCLARGGKLLYATCSVFAEENGQQIEAFLARHPDAVLLPSTPGGQLLPDERHDGFYYALLEKR